MYSVPAISSLKFERLNLKIKADLYFAKKKKKIGIIRNIARKWISNVVNQIQNSMLSDWSDGFYIQSIYLYFEYTW